MDKNKNSLVDSFEYLSIFKKYLGAKIYLFFFLIVVASVGEGFGFFLVVPLLERLGLDSNQSNSSLSQTLEQIYIFFGIELTDQILIFSIMIAFILKGILMFIALGFKGYLDADLTKILSKNYFLDIQK